MGAGTAADLERKLQALFAAKERELLEKCQEAAEDSNLEVQQG